MSFMMAFGWASIMLLLGVLLRARVPFLRNMLVPSSVIAGVLGIMFINALPELGMNIGTDTSMYTTIVNNLFTVSFISIALTSTPKEAGNSAKNTLQGSIGLGTVWSLLYALTPLVGVGILAIIGKAFDMDLKYGMLIQYAFCQGPGQSASYGAILEGYGWTNASTVAIAFSVVGFAVAFLVGIPMARLGVKHGIAKHCGKIDEKILKGYLNAEEQQDVTNKDTTCNSNLETLAFHFAVIGLCYILAIGISKLFSYIPGFIGVSFSRLMFMNGMYAAYIVKFIMKRLKIDFLLDNTLQSKITGWTADYLVVCAFMAVSVTLISQWLVPMLVVSIIITAITFVTCIYFGSRFGGTNDFERTLGMYGMCTGTVPSGIALVRIVDPNFQTSTSIELGACNVVMMLSMPVSLLIMAYASGAATLTFAVSGFVLCCVVYLVVLKVTHTWNKPTFSWKGKEE